MNLKLEIEFSKVDYLKRISSLKSQIDKKKPFPNDVEARVMQKLRLEWNYNSNAIEGNKLTYGETESFLMTGITAKGKPLKDYLDIRGHNEAILFLTSIVKEDRPLTESDIRALHAMVLVEPYEVKAQTADGQPTTKLIKLGEYKTSPNHVQTVTGEMHYYTSPEETHLKMQELMEWYVAAIANNSIHPIVIAARFHHKFVAIHPFDDGNGRLSRILMNLVLMKFGYPPAIIKTDDRQNYYSLLSQADAGDNWPFIEYVAERVEASLQLYLKAAKGGDIDEDEDIDKELALLSIQLMGNAIAVKTKNHDVIIELFQSQLFPLMIKVNEKLSIFETSFFQVSKYIEFTFEYIHLFNEFTIGRQSENFNINSLPKCIDILSNSKNEYTKIRFALIYDNYKSSENLLNIECIIDILLNRNNYEIYSVNGDLLLSKLYHEKISVKDYNFILKFFMEIFKDKIQKSLKA